MYVSAPKGELKKPDIELRAFGKTRLLEVGESQTMHFEIGLADLASFDPDLSLWVIDPGKYTIKIGASSTDIRARMSFHKNELSTLAP
jgi:beta-glucosidase